MNRGKRSSVLLVAVLGFVASMVSGTAQTKGKASLQQQPRLVKVIVRLNTISGRKTASQPIGISASYSEFTFAAKDGLANGVAMNPNSDSGAFSLDIDSNAVAKDEFMRWLRRNEIDIIVERIPSGKDSWEYECLVEYMFSDGTSVQKNYQSTVHGSNEQWATCGVRRLPPLDPEALRVDTTHQEKCRSRYHIYIDSVGAYICEHGKLVVGPSPSNTGSLGRFKEGMATLFSGDKYGFIDEKGRQTIASQFDYADDFAEGLAAVEVKGVWGFVDKRGEFAIPLQFERAQQFSEGLAAVKKGKFLGFIDKTGKIVIQPKFDLAGNFSEGLVAVRSKGKWGYIDTSGKSVISPRFDGAEPFASGLAAVKVNNRGGFINKQGVLVIQPTFESVEFSRFVHGRAPVKVGNKYGYIDQTGALLVKPVFDEVDTFSGGLARVQVDGLWGYIDEDGKFRIEPQFNEARPFDAAGIAEITTNDGIHTYIDRNGKVIWNY